MILYYYNLATITYHNSSPTICKTWTPFPLMAESNISLPDMAAVPTAMGLLRGIHIQVTAKLTSQSMILFGDSFQV